MKPESPPLVQTAFQLLTLSGDSYCENCNVAQEAAAAYLADYFNAARRHISKEAALLSLAWTTKIQREDVVLEEVIDPDNPRIATDLSPFHGASPDDIDPDDAEPNDSYFPDDESDS